MTTIKQLKAWWRVFKCRNDWHDYPDSTVGQPLHFYVHTCKHCGRGFTI